MSKKIVSYVILIAVLSIGIIYLFPLKNNSMSTDSTQDVEPARTLVKVTYSGGLCMDGGCFSSAEIFSDGNIFVSNNEGSFNKKIQDTQKLKELESLLVTTDIAELKSEKFEDICPIAYDGQKAVYEFYTNDGVVMVDSCEYVVDIKNPLYKSITEIVDFAYSN